LEQPVKKPNMLLSSTLAVMIVIVASILYHPYHPARNVVVFDGNSLTYGLGVPTAQNYPSQVAGLLGSGYLTFNLGVSGQTTPEMIADGKTQVDSLIGFGRSILVAWEITNDIYKGASPQTAYQDFIAYCQQRKVAGWKVIIMDVLPRSDRYTPAGFEISRQAVNGWLRRDFSQPTVDPLIYKTSASKPYADLLIDLAAFPELGKAGAQDNQAYYLPDRVHLSPAGYGILAKEVQEAILDLH
jgi:lysophospholipase L1-like esterase